MNQKNISQAHEKSSFAVIDPVYSQDSVLPASDNIEGTEYWYYGKCELEAFLLKNMRRNTKAAKLKVGYPGMFQEPSQTARFRRYFHKNEEIRFRACGNAAVEYDNRVIAEFENSEEEHVCIASADAYISIQVTADENDLPCIGSEQKWDFSHRYGGDAGLQVFPKTKSGKPPHKCRIPQVEVPFHICAECPECYDVGLEIFGFLEIQSAEEPQLFAGESVEETLNENENDFEQSAAVEKIGDDLYRTGHYLAFRYFRFKGLKPEQIRVFALYSPVQYKGAYASSERETKIWMNAAYTVRLCMHHFLIDGVKRDRLPWGGDLAVSLLSNAYSFAEPEIVRRTFRILFSKVPEYTDVNGIADYTLWVIINHDIYQRYFYDMDFLKSQYPKIWLTMESMLSRLDENGYLIRNTEWIFIDWVPQKSDSALQMILYWALVSASKLAERMKRADDKCRWMAVADVLKRSVQNRLWDSEKGLFRISALHPERAEFSRHANILAVTSGLADVFQTQSIVSHLAKNELPPVGTPYMSAFEAMACGMSGNTKIFSQVVESIWGGMLDAGATSFWEAFVPGETKKQQLVFYDRPYGRSLCHAWGSGPAFLYPMIQLGIKPLKDGWRTFSVCPLPGVDNVWCTTPTPYGNIEVSCCNGRINVSSPAECERVY